MIALESVWISRKTMSRYLRTSVSGVPTGKVMVVLVMQNLQNGFPRKVLGRNNHNAPKLIEKYNDLAREALSNGDKILSENYLQHADHFTRILNEKDSFRREKFTENKSENNSDLLNQTIENSSQNSEKNLTDVEGDDVKNHESIKTQAEIS